MKVHEKPMITIKYRKKDFCLLLRPFVQRIMQAMGREREDCRCKWCEYFDKHLKDILVDKSGLGANIVHDSLTDWESNLLNKLSPPLAKFCFWIH